MLRMTVAVSFLLCLVGMLVYGRPQTHKTMAVTVPPTLVVANLYQSAGGCQDTGRTERIGIPNYQLLDLGYSDPRYQIAGVSLRETNKVGNSGVRNVKFDPSQGVLSLEIFAGGGGSPEVIPFVGTTCVGASGGSYGVEVTAHYKTAKFSLTAQ